MFQHLRKPRDKRLKNIRFKRKKKMKLSQELEKIAGSKGKLFKKVIRLVKK